MNYLQLAVDQIPSRLQALQTSLQTDHPHLANMVGILNEQVQAIPVEVIYLVVMFLAAAALLMGLIAPLAGFSTYVERRVSARMQSRVGCNRVGPEGLLQFMADGIKLILKEDHMPSGSDKFLFRLAPYLVVAGAFLSFVTIPFGQYLVIADLNVGIFYLIAVSAISVVGILLAGWASNNKWSLLGSMRSAAQIVSYEIPVGLALMIPVMATGSLSLQEMNLAQAGGELNWHLFTGLGLAGIPAFFIFFIGGLAEANRTPFDLPEAESELVSGYNTEYSGIRWGMFFVGEYAHMFLLGALAVTAFLGGWQKAPSNVLFSAAALFFTLFFAIKSVSYLIKLVLALLQGRRLFDLLSTIRPIKLPVPMFYVLGLVSLAGGGLLYLFHDFPLVQALVFIAKAYFFVFVMIWIRWTLPRYRIDQMMDLCWKKLVPIGFFCLFWTATWMLVTQ